MHQLLVVDQHELGLALQQAGHVVRQHLRRPDAAVFDGVKRALAVTKAHVFADECLQLPALAFQKQRRAFQVLAVVLAVVRVVDLAIARVVVQVGAGVQRHRPVLHRGVEVFQVGGVGPGLVRRVGAFAFAAATTALGPDDGVLLAAA